MELNTSSDPARARSPCLVLLAARAAIAMADREPDAKTRDKAAEVLQDFLGCCLHAARGEAGRRMVAYGAAEQGAAADALIGGMLGHALIREDMHVPSGTHPGVVILPAMLALARRDGWTGRQLVRGIAAGYHFMCTLGMAVRSGLAHRHFRPLGLSGPFGVAGGAMAAAGEGEPVAVNALALAANFAAGLNQWPWSGGQDIYVHAGMAARNGIAAVDLARAGMRASPDILEGRDGLFAALGSGPDAPTVFAAGIADGARLLEATHKPVAGCNYVQTAAAVALQLRSQLPGSGTQSLRQVRIFTFSAARSYPGCDSQGPFEHAEQRKMSFQYAVCAALRHGRLDEAIYGQPADAELQRLIAVTEVLVDEVLDRRVMPAQPARVQVVCDDGRTLAGELPDVPWLDGRAVRQRFQTEAQDAIHATGFDRIRAVTATPWEHTDLAPLWWLWDEIKRLAHG